MLCDSVRTFSGIRVTIVPPACSPDGGDGASPDALSTQSGAVRPVKLHLRGRDAPKVPPATVHGRQALPARLSRLQFSPFTSGHPCPEPVPGKIGSTAVACSKIRCYMEPRRGHAAPSAAPAAPPDPGRDKAPSLGQPQRLGDSSMVEHRTLTPRIKVRILVPQPLEYLRIHNCLAHRPILPLASS